MNERPVYQSKGCKGILRYIVSGIAGIIFIVLTIYLFVIRTEKIKSIWSSYYRFDEQTRFLLLIFALFCFIIAIVMISNLFIYSNSRVIMYDSYMEFTPITPLVVFGISSTKHWQMNRINYSDIVNYSIKKSSSSIIISALNKKYTFVCNDTDKVDAVLRNKISR